ncbi:MAG TPA: hypothetical protein HPQ03_14465 [Deltaproteobacteria bacterium]|nr:hypothetical protein [Deltaproteobacteria bacterium]
MEIALLIILFIVVIIFLPMLLNKRAVFQVIQIFKKHGALDAESAKSIADLKLTKPTLKDRMMRFRDYKPAALESLIQVGVVQSTEDGRVFLLEERLKGTKFEPNT